MQQKRITTLVALVSLCGSSLAYSAQIIGKVTESNGTTPIANVPVTLYKYNPRTGNFDYNSYANTNAAGTFTVIPEPRDASASHPGGYYVTFGNFYSYNEDPFSEWGYYSQSSVAGYYAETYDDVTELTPNRVPKLVAITSPTQSVGLNLVKLSRKTKGCAIIGPMTINGVPYSYFYVYSGQGPKLPATGGVLNISFGVRNLSAAPIQTTVQSLAFLGHPDPALKMNHGITSLVSKTVTLPANATTNITLSATVPASFMNATPHRYSNDNPPTGWAFNIGINAVAGLPNCFSLTKFPVLKQTSSSAASEEQAPKVSSESPRGVIPLVLSEDGKPVKWGPRP